MPFSAGIYNAQQGSRAKFSSFSRQSSGAKALALLVQGIITKI
jgi:hypothetical protein